MGHPRLLRVRRDERLHFCWNYIGTLMLLCLAAMAIWLLLRPLPRRFRGDVFPQAFGIMWFVLLTQHVIAFLVTGPLNQWAEAIQWWIYYLLLFIISATVVGHFQFLKSHISGPALPRTVSSPASISPSSADLLSID